MRALFLIMALGSLALTIGCDSRNTYAYQPQEQTAAIGPPRVNLYPLTAPPADSVQPMQGYAPTRISAASTQYAPSGAPAYAGGTQTAVAPNYQQPTYRPGMGVTEPFPTGNYCPPWMPAGSVCTIENVTAGMNPVVPIGDPPVIVNNLDTGATYTTTFPVQQQQYAQPAYQRPPTYAAPTYPAQPTTYPTVSATGYTNVPASYSTQQSQTAATYAAPAAGTQPFPTGAYCPPWAPAGSNCTVENMTPGMNPVVPINDPPVIVNSPTYAPPAVTQPSSFGAPYANQPLSAVGSSYGAASSGSTPPVDMAAAYGAAQLRLAPAPDVPPGNRPGDAAPSQWFEIIRPGNGPIRIGRVSSTCVCVSVRVPNRFIAAGERALVEARIVSRPPVNNLTYGIYVNVMEPVQATLDADVTITLR